MNWNHSFLLHRLSLFDPYAQDPYYLYERGPNKNFKTHRKINTPDFLPFHNVPRYRYTCNILNYRPPFPLHDVADLSPIESREIGIFEAKITRRAPVADALIALLDRAARAKQKPFERFGSSIAWTIRLPPLFYRFHRSVLSTRSIALSNRISRSLPHLAPRTNLTFFCPLSLFLQFPLPRSFKYDLSRIRVFRYRFIRKILV